MGSVTPGEGLAVLKSRARSSQREDRCRWAGRCGACALLLWLLLCPQGKWKWSFLPGRGRSEDKDEIVACKNANNMRNVVELLGRPGAVVVVNFKVRFFKQGLLQGHQCRVSRKLIH